MNKIILTIGASGSGKTTFAEKLCTEDDTYVNVNRDDIRFSMFNYGVKDWTKYDFSKKSEDYVTHKQEYLVQEALANNKNIIISDTNLNKHTRTKWENWAAKNGYQYCDVLFPVAWDVLVSRNAQRDGGVAENVLWRQYKSYMQQYGFIGGNKVYPYEDNINLDHTVICDIDGTIATVNGRGYFDWDKVGEDLPRNAIIDMVLSAGLRVGHITFMSGRDAVCYTQTKEWIEKYVMDSTVSHIKWDLVMRPEGSFEKDYKVKYQLYLDHVKSKYNVHTVFDDRPQVLRLWSILDLPNVINVGEYMKEF